SAPGAAIEPDVVPVVALLAAFAHAVAADRELAIRAPVEIERIAVVALLVALEDAVPADGRHALVARICGIVVAVVALLATVHDAVPTPTRHDARQLDARLDGGVERTSRQRVARPDPEPGDAVASFRDVPRGRANDVVGRRLLTIGREHSDDDRSTFAISLAAQRRL